MGGSVKEPKRRSRSRDESESDARGSGGRERAGVEEDARRDASKDGGWASKGCGACSPLRKKALRNFLRALRARLGGLGCVCDADGGGEKERWLKGQGLQNDGRRVLKARSEITTRPLSG